MPPRTADRTEAVHPEDTVRMTLRQSEFLPEHGQKVPGGTVVLVDEETARRWRRKGVADDSKDTDQTLKEKKLAEIERLKAEYEAMPEHSDPVVASRRPTREIVSATGRE